MPDESGVHQVNFGYRNK